MKVLLTADTAGGVWTFALELCAALPEVEFVLATLGALPSREQAAEAHALANVRVESCACRLEWMPGYAQRNDEASEWLLGLAARHRPDLVHVNGYVHAVLPWRLPVLLGAHSCVVSWWRAVHGTDPPAEWNGYRARVAAAFTRADAVVAPSQQFLRELLALYGRPRRAWTIYNACERARCGPRQRENIVLAAGRLWDAAKNVAVLDRAADGLPAPVYVAGETRAPHGTHAVTRHARPLGALAAVDLEQWMRRAALFAAPALYEPFGLAPLEAARAGCALVLGDIPTLRELWQGAARFVPPRDADALRTTLAGLLVDSAERERLAARAGQRALLYSRQRMADGYRAAYRALTPAAFAESSARFAQSSAALEQDPQSFHRPPSPQPPPQEGWV